VDLDVLVDAITGVSLKGIPFTREERVLSVRWSQGV